jgi:hypothetical protein
MSGPEGPLQGVNLLTRVNGRIIDLSDLTDETGLAQVTRRDQRR